MPTRQARTHGFHQAYTFALTRPHTDPRTQPNNETPFNYKTPSTTKPSAIKYRQVIDDLADIYRLLKERPPVEHSDEDH